MLRVPADYEGLEIAHRLALGGERFGDQPYDVLAHRILLGVQFEAGHAVAQIYQRRARVVPHHAVGCAEPGDARDALGLGDGPVRPALDIETDRKSTCLNSS